MNKTTSGIILISIGIGMILLSRLYTFPTGILLPPEQPVLFLMAVFNFWNITAVVIALFGLYRLVTSLVTHAKRPDASFLVQDAVSDDSSALPPPTLHKPET